MTQTDLLTVLDLLRRFDVRVGGGWGVDALIGRQTRDHHDADLLVREEDREQIEHILVASGWRVVIDESPDRVVFERDGTARIDMNLLVYVETGDAYQRGAEGWFELFPADGFTVGTVAGRPVRCLTAAVQLHKHEGYSKRVLDEVDLATLQRLVAGGPELSS